MNRKGIRTALLGSGAAIALLVAGMPASADEIGDLRTQIDAMQTRIAKLEAEKAKIKRKVAAAAAVDAGDKPKSWKLPGTNTSMTIGGYAKLDLIYDFGNLGGPFMSANAIPINSTDDIQGNFQLGARQSRVNVRTSTPTDWGELATHIEVDFFGTAANGQNTLRMRHAYGRLGPVLAGQTWSTHMAVFYLGETLDFAGPSGLLFNRQPMIRYTHSLQPATQLIVAVEHANRTAGIFPIIGPIPGALTGPQWIPDFVVALHHRFGRRGGIYISAAINGHSVDNGVNFNDRTIGWSIQAAGAYRFTNRFAAGLHFNYGQGFSKWLDFADVDTVLDVDAAGNLSLEPVTMWGVYGWIQVKWTDTVRSNFAYGYTAQDVADAFTFGKLVVPAGTDAFNWKAHANIIWSPVPQVNIGIEYLVGFRAVYHSNNGLANRIQVALQYRW